MLCATAQNDQMELQSSEFLRMDFDEWQLDDNVFQEAKKKKVRSLTKYNKFCNRDYLIFNQLIIYLVHLTMWWQNYSDFVECSASEINSGSK